MRRVSWLLILMALVAVTGLGCNGPGGTAASCVGPYLDDQPPGGGYGAPSATVRPGDTLDIYGHWYTSTCNDTGGNDPEVPLPDVHLTLTLPGGEVQRLGRYAPEGRDLGFKATVAIPADARPGTATISDDRPQPATYRFDIRA
jgi:hypothetical protein